MWLSCAPHGLTWARNLTHHQWGMALRRDNILLEQQIAMPAHSASADPVSWPPGSGACGCR